jgi:PAS domain S-box-containing protein
MENEANRLPLTQARLGGKAALEYGSKLDALVEGNERAENTLRMLIKSLPVGLVITDEKGKIADLNESSLRMFGYRREELLGQPIETLLPERLRHAHEGHRAGYKQHPHTRPLAVGMELLARRKDGTEFPVEVSLGPLATKQGRLVSGTIVDITERKKIEQQLRLAQRMEAIGQLAGGIAHDFNNLLAVIMGSADILIDALPQGAPLGRKVEMIRSAGSSAADLIRQLLAFSRQQMLQPIVLDVREIIARTREMLKRIIGEDIEFQVFVEDSVRSISADPGQIEQVLLNLAANARDAMPKGGRLTIRASNVELDESEKKKHPPVVPGPYVMLTIGDTGCGMDQKTQGRIFDPFFTTKELGKGTNSAWQRSMGSLNRRADTWYTLKSAKERSSESTCFALIRPCRQLNESRCHWRNCVARKRFWWPRIPNLFGRWRRSIWRALGTRFSRQFRAKKRCSEPRIFRGRFIFCSPTS